MNYKWKRFWCPRDGQISFDINGFLYDPESEYRVYAKQDAQPFEEFQMYPCIVLLGEPGMGKSTEIMNIYETTKRFVDNPDKQIINLDLNVYNDLTDLSSDLFESEKLNACREENIPFYIFLDSLDECRFRIDTISQILSEKIRLKYYDNLFLRVACRTAECPNNFEKGLETIWGKENLRFIELVPLREKDIRLACVEKQIDQQKFLNQIIEKEVQPLAIKPITFNFLVDLFEKKKQLPSSRLELYDEGLRFLIEDPNTSRKESKLIEKFPLAQKMKIAERIAAITVLCSINSINNDYSYTKDVAGLAKEDLIIDDDTSLKVIESVIDSGLFSSRGKGKMGWAHQSYAEFLTARFLLNTNVSDEQIFSLVIDSTFREKKITPHLDETVAWLVSMKPSIYKYLVKDNPEVLLKCDLVLHDKNAKKLLIRNLLVSFEQQKLFDLKYSFKNHYKKLIHTDLAKQLRPFIRGKNKNWLVRAEAILIARECKQVDLLDDLIQVFCDRKDSLNIRVDAGWCLYKIADEPCLQKMKNVLATDLLEDGDDELKTICLTALWPKIMSTKELFSFLSRPKNTNYTGRFFHLIHKIVVEGINWCDLPVALNWVGTLGTRHGAALYDYEDLIDYIMYEGWKNIEKSEVLNAYVEAIKRLKRNYDEIVQKKFKEEFRAELQREDSKRRRLITAIVDSLSDEVNEIELFIDHNINLVLAKDFSWLIKKTVEENNEKKSRVWGTLASWSFDINNITDSEYLMLIARKNVIVSTIFSYWLMPIELSSEEAKKRRKRYLKFDKPRVHSDKSPLRRLGWEERVFQRLFELNAGEINAYWQILNLLQYDPEDNKKNVGEHAYDVQTFPGWKFLDSEQQKLIIDSSKTYLLEAEPFPNKWLGQNFYYHSSRAGYRAISLLFKTDIEFITSLDESIWKKWAASIIEYPSYAETENQIFQKQIIAISFNKASNDSLNAFKIILDKEVNSGDISILSKFEDCWDDTVSVAVLDRIKNGETRPREFSDLLEYLFRHSYKPAEYFFFSLISEPLPTDANILQKIVFGCSTLMVYRTREFWKIIWQLIEKYPDEIGKKVILRLPYSRKANINYFEELNAKELSELVVWITKNFSMPFDQFKRGIHVVTAEDEVLRLRDSIINQLKSAGKKDIHKVIKLLKKQLPEIEWLSRVEYESNIVTRAKSWQPQSLGEFKQLISNSKKRYIQNEDDLQRIVVDSLKRFQRELHGETPAVKFLWNSKPEKTTPKEETELSNFIKRYLKKDLENVLVNREVEIRGRRGKVAGEKPDIIVESVKYDVNQKVIDRFKLIIEVKCCFNKDYLTAMKSQLADRYLKRNQTKYGIYIAGWFTCESWDKRDGRVKRSVGRNKTLKEIEKYFAKQADELSQEEISVEPFVLDCRLV
ncbi:MAG: hypothetical protein C4517_08895 [Stygiobacter sp.]|nr:MAG: hypothetical protein A2299_18485 [Stygiobacter sp. RIFOXYB2_FULL_37_11]OGV15479.1 MAG: hypothetical protein A2440_00245 [Stygiobacter sp. RIFOXYC2_FULL_38_25]OGV18238.1 MAG: hypothetical protein A2237_15335 [Stygiobacter sp. RIFOXYA2_FULL_38_8]OGV80593.1 MAG: hypothetical protein A2X65_05295 [Stygiobacter sp. GWF2_38_21]RJQ61209.1 MAG: hypothetical protein C4517_08895 [Stygiobacter sp.]